MHSNYIFLIDVDEDNTPEDVAYSWEYSYANEYCDDNNWHDVHTVVLGKKVYEKKNGKSGKWSVKKAPGFDPKTLAMRIAATDLYLFNIVSLEKESDPDKIDRMSYKDLLKTICTKIPDSLSKAFAKMVGKIPSTEFNREQFSLSTTAKRYIKFINSGEIPPFSKFIDTPYEWRCYDLRNKCDSPFDPKDHSYLIADIHT